MVQSVAIEITSTLPLPTGLPSRFIRENLLHSSQSSGMVLNVEVRVLQ